MRRRYHSRLPEIDWPYLLAPTLAARPDRRVPSTGMGPARHHRVSNGRSNEMERLFAELHRQAAARPDHAAPGDRACTLLPLSTLLANIGGVYAPRYSGGSAWLPDLAECMSGSTGLNRASLLAMLQRVRPTVTIVVPQLLKALVDGVANGAPWPTSLRFIAVGGAPTAPALLARSRALV